MKKISVILSFLLLMVINTNIYASNDFNTTIYIKDVGFDNKTIVGFEYSMESLNGEKYSIKDLGNGIATVSLPKGKYIMKEIKTPDRYLKSDDLKFELPINTNNKTEKEISIYPKHYPNPNYNPPVKPISPGEGVNPKYGDNEKDKPSTDGDWDPKDLGERDKVTNNDTDKKEPDNNTDKKDDKDKGKKKDDKTNKDNSASAKFEETSDSEGENKPTDKAKKYLKTGYTDSNILLYAIGIVSVLNLSLLIKDKNKKK